MKPAKACQQCRISKRKCIEAIQKADAGCAPCQQRKLKCSKSYDPRLSRSKGLSNIVASNGAPPKTAPGTAEFVSLSIEDTMEFVDLYMRFIHDRPHSLFHEKTLWADVRSGAMSQCLLVAICAFGCRFSANLHHRQYGTDLRIKSRTIFSQQLETISLSNVQTCILLANLYAAEQDNGLEALYFGIANRMAHVLRLHEDCAEDSAILREIKRRVWWSLWMADKWCPPGLGLPREIASSGYSVGFPIDEVAFQLMDQSTQPYVDHNSNRGMWRYMVSLADNLGPIQDLNQSLVRNIHSQQEVEERVVLLAERLNVWHATLPSYMILSEDNLDMYRGHRQGGTLIALHLGYHHYCTLLYFQYLDPASGSTTQTKFYADRCRYHAMCLSKLLHTARQKGDCQVVYLTVAYLAMVSSSVLLHLLLFGEDEEEVEVARMQLTYNFEALVELREYWPHMDKITQRLLTFQDACLRSSSTKTHKIDRWMVRFLLEHALPLETKDSGNNDTSSDQMSPSSSDYGVSAVRTSMLNQAFADLRR